MKARKMPFDTLRFANRMKSAGMDPKLAEEQAEAIAEALYDSLEAKIDNLVTKDYLKAELTELRQESKHDNASLRQELKEEIAELRINMERIEKRLGRMIVAAFSAVAVLMGLIQHFHP